MAEKSIFIVALCCLGASMPVHGRDEWAAPTTWTAPNTTSASAVPSLIDRLRLDYIRLEQDLWTLIHLENDAAVSLEAVHKTHLAFFRSDFDEVHVKLDEVDPDHLQLYHAFAEVNRTVTVLVKNYLHSNPLRYDEKRTIAICRQLSNLTHHLDAMSNIMTDTDFYNTIKNVSEATYG